MIQIKININKNKQQT